MPPNELHNGISAAQGRIRNLEREHCKTVGSAYVGSNPTPATLFSQVKAGVVRWWHRLLRTVHRPLVKGFGPAVGQIGRPVAVQMVLQYGFEQWKWLSLRLPCLLGADMVCGPLPGPGGVWRTADAAPATGRGRQPDPGRPHRGDPHAGLAHRPRQEQQPAEYPDHEYVDQADEHQRRA
jgi:hypothetical protein